MTTQYVYDHKHAHTNNFFQKYNMGVWRCRHSMSVIFQLLIKSITDFSSLVILYTEKLVFKLS